MRVEIAGIQMGISRLPQGIDKSSSNVVLRTIECIGLSPVVELHEEADQEAQVVLETRGVIDVQPVLPSAASGNCWGPCISSRTL
jgi:hypothetical protein